MSKVQVTADGLRALYSHAKGAGTIGAWAEVALEWADKAESELARLKAIVDKLKKSDDGMPLIPDQQYWIVCHETYGEEEDALVSHATYCDSETLHEGYGWEWNIPDGDAESYVVLSVWSTREAAEAAQEKT